MTIKRYCDMCQREMRPSDSKPLRIKYRPYGDGRILSVEVTTTVNGDSTGDVYHTCIVDAMLGYRNGSQDVTVLKP